MTPAPIAENEIVHLDDRLRSSLSELGFRFDQFTRLSRK